MQTARRRRNTGAYQNQAHDSGCFPTSLDAVPGIERSPSDANFFLLKLRGLEAACVRQALSRESLVVRHREDMPKHIRVTSMLPDENRRLVGALRRVANLSQG